MKRISATSIAIGAAAALVAAALTVGSSSERTPITPSTGTPTADLWTLLTGGSFTDFTDLIEAAGFDVSLDVPDSPAGDLCSNGGAKYTVFAPTNGTWRNSFQTLLNKSWAEILATPGLPAAIVNDHVINNAVSKTEMENDSLIQLVARSGFLLSVTDTTPTVTGDRVVGSNVKVAGKLLLAEEQACNGWLYSVETPFGSTGQVPTEGLPPETPSVQWTSPSTPTTSRHLLFELRLSNLSPISSVLTASDFENLGTQQGCTMTPVPENVGNATSKYFLIVSCPGSGTVKPRLTSTSVFTGTTLGAGTVTSISDTSGASTVDIVNGFALTVTKSGSGQGTVSSNVSGINCGAMCVGVWGTRQQITLTATPAPGSLFIGWSGACSGTGTCRINLSSSVTATAQFELGSRIIITRAGSGSGSVTSTSPRISCPINSSTPCAIVIKPGTSVTLQARADRGSRFVGWMGSCAGTGSCVIPAQTPGQITHAIPIFEIT